VENGYSENHLIEHRLKKYKPLIWAGFEYPGEGQKLIFQNKEALQQPETSTKVISLFRLLVTFNLLGYTSEITTPICDIDAITLVSAVFHDAIFTTRTSW